jgi:hypothetical protein
VVSTQANLLVRKNKGVISFSKMFYLMNVFR